MKKNKENKIISIVFLFTIVFLTIVTLFSKKDKFSEIENRPLAGPPKVSISRVMNRTFMKDLDAFITDNFYLRETWVNVKGSVERGIGKKETKDVFICDNRLIGRISEPEEHIVNANIEGINNLAQKTDTPISFMLVPSASEIQKDKLPKNAEYTNWDQGEFTKKTQGKLDTKILPIDIYKQLMLNNEEEIYYRTDHHWTTQGAYLAYVEAGRQLSYEGININNFSIENKTNEFYGTLYSKVPSANVKPDTIQKYETDMGNKIESVSIYNGQETKNYDSMYFEEYLDKKDKYAYFLGQNEPMVNIKTNDKNGKKLLIFKDSYAHAMVPFLANHYSEITLVDLRYFNESYLKHINPDDYDNIMLVYSMELFITDSSISSIDGEE